MISGENVPHFVDYVNKIPIFSKAAVFRKGKTPLCLNVSQLYTRTIGVLGIKQLVPSFFLSFEVCFLIYRLCNERCETYKQSSGLQ